MSKCFKTLIADRRQGVDVRSRVRNRAEIRITAQNADFGDAECPRAGHRHTRGDKRESVGAVDGRCGCACLLDDLKVVTALITSRKIAVNENLSVQNCETPSKCTVAHRGLVDDLSTMDRSYGR